MEYVRALHYRDRDRFGVSRRKLRGPIWTSPTHAIYLLATDVDDLAARCRAVQLALPDDAVFTHITAAALRGWWLPSIRIPMVARSNATAPHLDRRGVYIRRCAVPSYQRLDRSGLRIASAERTLLELAEDLSLVDLVIAIDAALHLKDTTLAALSRAVVPGRRGVRTLRRALALADHRSESPWEAVLRLLHELGCIDVTPQYIVTGDQGIPVARGDLRVGHSRRLHEYDGAVHREGGQHGDDLGRDKALARIEWKRYGYTAKEIRLAPGRILRDAEDALGLPHDPVGSQHGLRSTNAAACRPPAGGLSPVAFGASTGPTSHAARRVAQGEPEAPSHPGEWRMMPRIRWSFGAPCATRRC